MTMLFWMNDCRDDECGDRIEEASWKETLASDRRDRCIVIICMWSVGQVMHDLHVHICVM